MTRTIFYEKPLMKNDSLYAIFVLLLTIWITVNIWLVHLVVTKIGLAIVNSKVLNIGNSELLNNLD